MAKAENIPNLEFSKEALASSTQEHEKRRELCKKVREACENNGCFLMMYTSDEDHDDGDDIVSSGKFFKSMKTLFDLPEETKSKHVNPKPYRSYSGMNPKIPFYQSFGLDDAHKFLHVQDFTHLMWPHGNPGFCETMRAMSSKLQELNMLVLKIIFESFGMEKHYDSHVQDSTSLFKVMKYMSPSSIRPGGDEEDDDDENTDDSSAIALPAHRDKNAITILCQNEVQGLEIETKDGKWIPVVVPGHAFVVIVGEALKVWSNGRLEAARHRVVIRGKEDRYSCALFSMPKEESKIEVPCELVDKDHPLLYRPFIFSDYISYYVSNVTDDALEIYAGI